MSNIILWEKYIFVICFNTFIIVYKYGLHLEPEILLLCI